MSNPSLSEEKPSRIVIAGGGFAALEAALALRALAGRRVDLTLISGNPGLVYRPAVTAEAFDEAASRIYDLAEIATDLGATYHPFALEAVTSQEKSVRLASGLTLDYDHLILATGARASDAVSGALTFRDHRDLPSFKAVLDQLATGHLRRLAFAIPSSHCWALPAYELALLTSLHAAEHSAEVEISLVTPEPTPLALFGEQVARPVAELLTERGIRFVGNSMPHSVARGSLTLQFDASVRADHVVALPELYAARIAGVPATWSGFVPTDGCGRVEGLSNVYAAGDMTTFPVKQGGIAAQQADRIAHTIAAELGVQVKELHHTLVLRARLLIGDGALVLRTELDELGHPTTVSIQHRESRRAEDLKVFGRYLTPYLSMAGPRLRLNAAVA